MAVGTTCDAPLPRRPVGPLIDPPGHGVRRVAPGRELGILGPRTTDQVDDLLGAADVDLDSSVLDRIDEIVAPGVDLNGGDIDYTPPPLSDPALRRRPAPTGDTDG